ncbi:TPA: TatD family hydrolase, partial [Pseudomonas aeruginosa]|nr:TatD family hydrolase [Pseudomonas aeruginosa]
MRLVDTHNHLDFPDFDADRAALLQRSRALGVERQVVLGVYRENWQRVWDLAQAEDGLYAALGLHPVYLARHRPQHLDDLRQWLQRLRGETKLCAVGEIGLDYYLEHLDRDAQQALFEAQLRLAAEFRLPALIHVRRAHAATIATLKRIRLERRGIIHAFAGSREEAREYLKLGFRLGLGGAPTWPQANRLRKVAAELPAEAIVLETDAP